MGALGGPWEEPEITLLRAAQAPPLPHSPGVCDRRPVIKGKGPALTSFVTLAQFSDPEHSVYKMG